MGLKSLVRKALLDKPFEDHVVQYDNYWVERRGQTFSSKLNDFQVARANRILDHVCDGDTLLDIGAGDGAVLNHLAEKRDVTCSFIEISEKSAKHLTDSGFTRQYSDLTVKSINENVHHYDVIILFEVLEHLSNPEEILTALLNKARKKIFFSVPNTGYYEHRLRLALGRFPVQWRRHPGEHLRFWTYRDLIWWLKQLEIDRITSIEGYMGAKIGCNLFPNLFCKGLIGIISTEGSHEDCNTSK